MHLIVRSLGAMVAVVVALALAATSASASTPTTCDASVLSVGLVGQSVLSLGTAGTPGGPCADDASTPLNLTAPLGLLNLSAGVATASTASGPPSTATAQVAGLNAGLGLGSFLGLPLPLLNLGITADAVEMKATGSCVSDYTTSGKIANLTIAGIPITDANGNALVADGSLNLPVNLLGLIQVTVQLNHEDRTATGVSRDGARIAVSAVSGLVPVANITIAHVAVGGGDACPSTPGGPGNPPGGGTTTTTTTTTTATTPVTTPVVTTPVVTTPVGTTSTPTKPNNGTNASTCARIKMWFVPRVKNTARYKTHPGPTSITTGVEHGVRYVTRGVIKTCTGKPIVRARIDVYHIVRGKKLRKTGIRSRAGGLLTLILPSNLATRQIRFEYRPNTNAKKVAATATLRKTTKSKAGRLLY